MKHKNYLICFDLDGVLIDSMEFANRLFYKIAKEELGLKRDYFKEDPYNATAIHDRFEPLWGDEIRERGIGGDQLVNVVNRFRKEKMEAKLPPLPHAIETVKRMAEHFENIACVSSNAHFVIEDILKKLQIDHLFGRITGCDEVEMSKPHPAIYQVTLDHFNITPEKGITFEDSIHGINAAKGAGMKAIGVGTGLDSMESLQKSSADLVIPNLSEATIKNVSQVLGL